MKLKQLLLSVPLLFCSINGFSQITLTPVFDSAINGLNENNVSIVDGRLKSLISSMDMVSGYGGRFVLACRVAALQREVSGTKLIQHLQVSFAVGDNMSDICFGSTTTECYGIGNTEEQAMTSALRNIKANKQLKDLIASSKERIIDYYNQNCGNIIHKSQSLVTGEKWEEALYELSFIPQECACYHDALDMMESVFNSHMNHDAQQILNEAQAIWSADPNPGPAAEQAMAVLAQIDTNAKCYPQAKALMDKISRRVQSVSDEERRNEHEMERARLKVAESVAKARIQAYRDVATAYARRTVVVRNYYRTWW